MSNSSSFPPERCAASPKRSLQRVSESFEDALTRVGHKVEHHHYPNSEHSDLPMRYGKGGASDISSKVESFLASVKWRKPVS